MADNKNTPSSDSVDLCNMKIVYNASNKLKEMLSKSLKAGSYDMDEAEQVCVNYAIVTKAIEHLDKLQTQLIQINNKKPSQTNEN